MATLPQDLGYNLYRVDALHEAFRKEAIEAKRPEKPNMATLPETCPNPKCGANFQGKKIPQECIDAGHYGNSTHYSRVIAITCPVRDRITLWKCPDCGHEWKRE